MAALEIICFPDPRLRKIAEPVTQFNAALTNLIRDMFETMYEANGIGLAATQVNIHKQVIVMDLSESRNEPRVFINPSIEIVDESEKAVHEEGCLSVPGFYDDVERPTQVKVHYQNEHGEEIDEVADSLLSVCIQHEMDHLNGKLFVDYLSNIKKSKIRKKLEKKQREHN